MISDLVKNIFLNQYPALNHWNFETALRCRPVKYVLCVFILQAPTVIPRHFQFWELLPYSPAPEAPFWTFPWCLGTKIPFLISFSATKRRASDAFLDTVWVMIFTKIFKRNGTGISFYRPHGNSNKVKLHCGVRPKITITWCFEIWGKLRGPQFLQVPLPTLLRQMATLFIKRIRHSTCLRSSLQFPDSPCNYSNSQSHAMRLIFELADRVKQMALTNVGEHDPIHQGSE